MWDLLLVVMGLSIIPIISLLVHKLRPKAKAGAADLGHFLNTPTGQAPWLPNEQLIAQDIKLYYVEADRISAEGMPGVMSASKVLITNRRILVFLPKVKANHLTQEQQYDIYAGFYLQGSKPIPAACNNPQYWLGLERDVLRLDSASVQTIGRITHIAWHKAQPLPLQGQRLLSILETNDLRHRLFIDRPYRPHKGIELYFDQGQVFLVGLSPADLARWQASMAKVLD